MAAEPSGFLSGDAYILYERGVGGGADTLFESECCCGWK